LLLFQKCQVLTLLLPGSLNRILVVFARLRANLTIALLRHNSFVAF